MFFFWSKLHVPGEMHFLILFKCLFLFLSLFLQAVRVGNGEHVYFWLLDKTGLSTLSRWMRDAAVELETELRTGHVFFLLCLRLMTLSTPLMTVFKCTLSAHSQAVMSNVGHAVHLASLNISAEILERSHCLISLKGNQPNLLFHCGNNSRSWSHVRNKSQAIFQFPYFSLSFCWFYIYISSEDVFDGPQSF